MTKEERNEKKKPGVAKAGKPSEVERSENFIKNKEIKNAYGETNRK